MVAIVALYWSCMLKEGPLNAGRNVVTASAIGFLWLWLEAFFKNHLGRDISLDPYRFSL